MKKIYILLISIVCMMLTSCQTSQSELNFGGIAQGQDAQEETTARQEPLPELPIIAIDDVEIHVGVTRLQELLDVGYIVKFMKDGTLYDISSDEKIAEVGYSYAVQLYKEDKQLADLTYSNNSNEKQTIGGCVIDALNIYLIGDYADAQVSVDGQDLRSISIDDVMSLYSGYKKASTSIPTYRLTTDIDDSSYIATIMAASASDHAISSYELTRYQN